MKGILTLSALIFFGILHTSAQVVINEYSATNLKTYPDNYGKFEDWIELYNTGDTEVSLAGWYLSDNDSKPAKWKIPAGVKIESKGFLIVFASGRNEFKDGFLHADWKLNQTEQEDFLILSKPDKIIVDKYKLAIIQQEQSICRKNDGSPEWVYTKMPTPGRSNSEDQEFQFTGFSPTPYASVKGGFYDTTVVVRLVSPLPANYTVRYTTTGREPQASSPVFPDSLVVSETTVLKLRAFCDDSLIIPSFIDFNTYFIKDKFSLPVFSVAADRLINLAEGNKELRPVGSIEYFDRSRQRRSTGYGELNSHGQDSWVLDQRSLDWITRDEMGYAAALYQPLFDLSDRREYQRFIFRASGDDNYPAINDGYHDHSTHMRDEYVHTLSKEGGMALDVRTPQRAIVYLNGRYWGVYTIRERPDDHDFTDHYYKQDKYELQYLQTWAYTWAEYGGDKAISDWQEIRDFILDNDMSQAANYSRVDEAIDLVSLSDYFIMNLNVVASDWLNYNTGWWRGLNDKGSHKKWGYTLWDNDATFDYYINYSGVPNVSPTALPCDIEQIAHYIDAFFGGTDVGKHEQILLKLLTESATFRQLYYSRYADLMNTVFTCENMTATLDRMIAEIEGEMPRHIQRWGGSMDEWRENLDRLRSFVESRCNRLADGLTDCYEPDNYYPLTIMTDPPGMGDITLNTLKHSTLPWTGTYYDEMDQLVSTASKVNDQIFSHWLSKGKKITIHDSTLASTGIRLLGPDTLVAVFKSTLGDHSFSLTGARIYPSLSDNLITVDAGQLNVGEEVECHLVDACGKVLYRWRMDNNGRKREVSLAGLHLASGLYFVNLASGKRNESFKVSLIR